MGMGGISMVGKIADIKEILDALCKVIILGQEIA